MMCTLRTKSKALNAIKLLNEVRERLVVILDANNRVLGTVSDGDIRRGILKGYRLDDDVDLYMCKEPLLFIEGRDRETVLKEARLKSLTSVPVVNAHKVFKGLASNLHDEQYIASQASVNCCAIIMAGGKGTRLRPITETLPKPMVDVDGRPLLVHLIEQFREAGIYDIYISVNYLSEVIEEYFQDGDGFGVNIKYLREEKELGTAGALSELPKEKFDNHIVINGDILTQLNLRSFVDYHELKKADLSLCTISHDVTIPYGVVEHADGSVLNVREKPTYSYLCNAGIYILSSKVLSILNWGGEKNMTDVIDECLSASLEVATFPLHEYWSDVGTLVDLQNARDRFSSN